MPNFFKLEPGLVIPPNATKSFRGLGSKSSSPIAHLPRSLFLSLHVSDDTQIDAANHLPARLRNAFARAGIRTAGGNLSDVDLFKLPGVGRSSLRMLRMLGPSLDGGAALLPSG